MFVQGVCQQGWKVQIIKAHLLAAGEALCRAIFLPTPGRMFDSSGFSAEVIFISVVTVP